MSEAERIEMSEDMSGVDTLQGTERAEESGAIQPGGGETPETDESMETSGISEAAAELDMTPPDEATDGAAHGLSNATLESMSRTDPLALAVAEAERTKWERRKSFVRDRVQSWCKQYMADGGFKLGIALVTAVIAAAIIVIAGIFSDRQLDVVFCRALVGFCVSGVFMGGTLYWLDRIGIPLFIARHEDQIQMEWLAEAEEPEGEAEASEEEQQEQVEDSELEELLTQEGEEPPPESQETATTGLEGELSEENAEPSAEGEEEQMDAADGNLEEEAAQQPEEAQGEDEGAVSDADIGGLEDAVLDDAFSSGEAEEESTEPPTFAPMTADNLESLSVPES